MTMKKLETRFGAELAAKIADDCERRKAYEALPGFESDKNAWLFHVYTGTSSTSSSTIREVRGMASDIHLDPASDKDRASVCPGQAQAFR